MASEKQMKVVKKMQAARVKKANAKAAKKLALQKRYVVFYLDCNDVLPFLRWCVFDIVLRALISVR